MFRKKNGGKVKLLVGILCAMMILTSLFVVPLAPVQADTSLGTVTISVDNKVIESGKTVIVGVYAKNIPAPGLAGYDMSLTYDPTVLDVLDVYSTGGFAQPTANFSKAGIVNVTAAQTAGVSGNVKLFNMTVMAKGAMGTSSLLNLTVKNLVDPVSLTDIPYVVTNGSITVGQAVGGPKVIGYKTSGKTSVSIFFDRNILGAAGQQNALTVTDESSVPQTYPVSATALGATNELVLTVADFTGAVGGLHVAYDGTQGSLTDESGNKCGSFSPTLTFYTGPRVIHINNLDTKTLELTYDQLLDMATAGSTLGWSVVDANNTSYAVQGISLRSV
jgi:hypothetical protein